MYKIKPGTLTLGSVKKSFKVSTERFVASDFSFMGSVKGTPVNCKQFLYDVLAIVK